MMTKLTQFKRLLNLETLSFYTTNKTKNNKSHGNHNNNNNKDQNNSYLYLLGMIPVLTLLNEKLNKEVNSIFFKKEEKLKRNEMNNRISSIQYAANDPIEDRFSVRQIEVEGKKKGYLVSVFDGHGGWQVAEYCEKHLADEFQKEIKQCSSLEQAMNQAYDNVENGFLNVARTAYQNGFGVLGKIGACSVSVYTQDNTLLCANSGDSQAILIQYNPETKQYNFVKLNKKLNAMSKKEQARLKEQHKDEKDIFKCKSVNSCYVKSVLQPTRSFGDFRLKYAEFNDPENHGEIKGYRRIHGIFKGPYITHHPQIREFQLTKNDEFVVVGCDGLWDELTKQQVTDIVGSVIKDDMQKDRESIKQNIVNALLKQSIEVAAQQKNITKGQLAMVPVGSARRRIHDDITIVVIDLKNQSQTK